jgi:hypothetical protein
MLIREKHPAFCPEKNQKSSVKASEKSSEKTDSGILTTLANNPHVTIFEIDRVISPLP